MVTEIEKQEVARSKEKNFQDLLSLITVYQDKLNSIYSFSKEKINLPGFPGRLREKIFSILDEIVRYQENFRRINEELAVFNLKDKEEQAILIEIAYEILFKVREFLISLPKKINE